MTEIWAQYRHYNRLANETLSQACGGLSDAEYRRDLGAFFKSVHGTLNHLLLGDTIWMARFEGGAHASTNLDAILHEGFDALRQARAAMDQRIKRFFANLPEGFERRPVRYLNTSATERPDPLPLILPHFFN